jgi:alpha-mannosidase
MIARARLAADLEGVPRVSMGRVDGFFTDALATHGPGAPRWVGEMYFEKHRGTYSTQLGTKQGNRTSERLLHEVELWAAAAGRDVPGLDTLWKRVLTQQFHDIIPGSSIAWVHDDAEQEHREVAAACEKVLGELLSPVGDAAPHAVNPSSVRFTGVVEFDGAPAWTEVPAFSWAPVHRDLPHDVAPVGVRRESDGSFLLDNGTISARISAEGHLASLIGHGRDVLGGRDARLVLRPDTPAEYDAWDIDRADADSPSVPVEAVGPPRIVIEHPLRVVVETDLATETSRFVLRHVLDAGADRVDIVLEASWHESERRLQWVLPVDLLAREAVMGTQFGHVRRPRHANTTWDLARFETCGHRWAACSEPAFGAAILADGPRGYDVRGDAMRLTVLRSPRFPDPEADRGEQRIEWSVAPLPGDPVLAGIEERAASMACPPRVVPGTPAVAPPGVEVLAPGVLASAVKPAEDGSGDLVVRLWETRGARTSGRLVVTSRAGGELRPCTALEDPVGDPLALHPDGGWTVSLDPFRILTLRLTGN